jgi:GR25 family glycosyltransferase involved in LPS biosynthesis
MEKVDHIYYINLDYRTDRRLQFEDWLTETNVPTEKITRISGIHMPTQGHRGCCLSHILALETFLDSPYQSCLIFEDDYKPVDKRTFWDNFKKIQEHQIEYDIILCAYNQLQSEDTDYPWLKRVSFSFTTSGYLITREGAKRLRALWEDSYLKLVDYEETHKRKADCYMLDVTWTELMKTSLFFTFYPRIGLQTESYSDLQGHVTNYNA